MNTSEGVLVTGFLQGVLTECDLPEAESVFPGITGFFLARTLKPRTFLDLVVAYEREHRPS